MPLVLCSPASLVWRVESLDDAPMIQARARTFVGELGFATDAQWCVAIAASELATNAVKYAGGGTLSLAWVEAPPYVLLEAVDSGPGIDDPTRAATDFVSGGVDLRNAESVVGRSGTGTGLGSIGRLMDTRHIENLPRGGLRVEARKYLKPRPR